MSVLVVDDDPAFLESMTGVLSLEFDVDTCTSGAQALRRLNSRDYHVVVADWMMPGMDGVELIERILARRGTTACLLISGEIEAALERLADNRKKTIGVMGKPFPPEELLNRVRMHARFVETRRLLQGQE